MTLVSWDEDVFDQKWGDQGVPAGFLPARWSDGLQPAGRDAFERAVIVRRMREVLSAADRRRPGG
jgi:hypothetical protein